MELFTEEGIIQQEQADSMMTSFEVHAPKSRQFKFVSAVTVIGAILVGLGILSYIASNWDHFAAMFKVVLIFTSMIGFYGVGILTEKRYLKVGLAFQYIAVFIFGGGLFLIDQIYNLNLNVADHFALWLLGLIPMVYIHRDYLIHIFVQLLTAVYLFSIMEGYPKYGDVRFYGMTGFGAILTGLWMYLNEKRLKSMFSLFINNFLPLIGLTVLFAYFEWNIVAFTGIMLLYGIYLYYNPLLGGFADMINRFQGVLIMGIAGFMFSFEDLWEEWDFIVDGTSIAIVFSIVFMVYLFWLTRKGIVTSLVFICIFILRFYFDTFYEFLPKSVFFMIGGGILLAFGYYLERVKRKKGALTHANELES